MDAVLEACDAGDAATVEQAVADDTFDPIAAGADGRRPLHRAAAAGRRGVVALLIDTDDSVLERGDHRGNTPLLLAAAHAPRVASASKSLSKCLSISKMVVSDSRALEGC